MGAKEYYSIEEACELVGRNRATVYNRMKILDIKPKKFKMDRKAYITADEVEQIKTVLAKPWLAGEKEEKSQEKSQEKSRPKNEAA